MKRIFLFQIVVILSLSMHFTNDVCSQITDRQKASGRFDLKNILGNLEKGWIRDTAATDIRGNYHGGMKIVRANEPWPYINRGSLLFPASNKIIPDGFIGMIFPYNGIDCHSTFEFFYKINDNSQSLDYRIIVHDGGCRAGGNYFNRITIIPFPNENYKIILKISKIGMRGELIEEAEIVPLK